MVGFKEVPLDLIFFRGGDCRLYSSAVKSLDTGDDPGILSNYKIGFFKKYVSKFRGNLTIYLNIQKSFKQILKDHIPMLSLLVHRK